MNKPFLMIYLAIGTLMFASLACEASASTANISSVVLTADPSTGVATTTFTPDQTFYAVVTLNNAPDTTKTKAVWYTVDENGDATQIAEKEVIGSGSPITFNATNSNAWPAGTYRVEIYLNDKVNNTIDFTVE
jgi:outer membrane usher protein FimD/PapC